MRLPVFNRPHAAINGAPNYLQATCLVPNISPPFDSAQSIDLSGGDDAVLASVCPASLLTIAEELHPRVHPRAA